MLFNTDDAMFTMLIQSESHGQTQNQTAVNIGIVARPNEALQSSPISGQTPVHPVFRSLNVANAQPLQLTYMGSQHR